MSMLSDLPTHTAIMGGFLMFFVLLFVIRFLIPAIYQNWKLGRYTKKVDGVDKAHLDGLSELFSKDRILDHLWKEFRDTLHEQKELDASGVYQITAIRQTIPAEMYFSEQMLVYSPLKTEFFKHLPGILTGIGVIGTFGGLISSLLMTEAENI